MLVWERMLYILPILHKKSATTRRTFAQQTAEKETSLSVNVVSSKEQNQIILYHPNDTISLEVRLENDTMWLTQAQIANLFGVGQPAISKHLKNIFTSEELDINSVYSILEYTANDGKIYNNGQIFDAYKFALY